MEGRKELGEICNEQGWISLGPWGTLYVQDLWSYKPEWPIMEITVSYGNHINSIVFRSKSSDGVFIERPEQIGDTGGAACETETFFIDSSVEQLSSINLAYRVIYGGAVSCNGSIGSICFETNIGKRYGLLGARTDFYDLSIPIEGGVITGFHGRVGAGSGICAIGIFVAPKVNSTSPSIQDHDSASTSLKGKTNEEKGCISLGPWGGKGDDWVYKFDGHILQINICHGKEINSILFRTRRSDGLVIRSSEKFGGIGGDKTEMFCIDSLEEQLLSITMKYKDDNEQPVITYLLFQTTKKKYGPFGESSNNTRTLSLSDITGGSDYFPTIPIQGGDIVGFHGRHDGTYLTAIGIFVAPKVKKETMEYSKGKGKATAEENEIVLSKEEEPMERSNGKGKATAEDNEIVDKEVFGSDVGFKPKILEIPTIKPKWSSRFLVAKSKAIFCGSKPRTFENIIIHNANAASSSGTTNKDEHHGEAPSLSTEIIPLATNTDDHNGGALSPTYKMIHSNLILLRTAFTKAKESMGHLEEKINQAEEKFQKLQTLPSGEKNSDELQKADSDKKELRNAIAKLNVQVGLLNKLRSADSNSRHWNWDNINEAEDGMTHFFHKEPEVAQTGDFDGILKAFHELQEPLQYCLLCFFKFPPMATIKRTPLYYLWIGQGYISEYPSSEAYVWDVEVHAGKIFDELIAKGFIDPIYQNYSLVPDCCKMSSSVRSCLYQEAERRGFTSNGPLDLDPAFVCDNDLIRRSSCLINVGEAIINFQPEIFESMKHIQSLYLGKWQSSATHHIEPENAKIFHGLNKLKSLTFLSLRGISMITELPTFITELHNLMILDLRACHNLEVVPDKIGLLKSLTHLDMSECYFLEHMPKSLAQLSNLQVLKGFLIGDFNNKKQSCTLHDLSRLKNLRKLNIRISFKDILRLQDLQYLDKFEGLKKLTISWGRLEAPAEVITNAFHVATLPRGLQKLNLQCFPITSLSNWLMPGKLKELKKLYITGGKLRDLGEFQKWHQGERLTVKILRLEYLSELELYWKELRTLFPELIYLRQVNCPKFIDFPSGVWINETAVNTDVQLQKYYNRTNGMVSSSSMASGST